MTAQPWFEIERTIPTTTAASNLFKKMTDAGLEVINFGQGKEIDMPPEEIRMKWEGRCGVDYNTENGGLKATRAVLADFLVRFYGMPADEKNTFVVQANGRNGINALLTMVTRQNMDAGNTCSPLVEVDDPHWTMYEDMIKNHAQYTVLASQRERVLENSPEFMSSIVADPDNPTGKIRTLEEHKNLRKGYREEIPLYINHLEIRDCPYLYASPPGNSNYLGVNYSQFLSQQDHPSRPWAIVVSFSKSDGTARPGLYAIVVHPSLIKNLTDVLGPDNGFSYDVGYMNAAAESFGEKNDPARIEHYARHRAKYTINRHCMETHDFPLLPGAPSMTAALQAEDLISRKVWTEKFGTREIKDIHDLVEFLANVTRVITVAQTDKVLRTALAARPENFEEGAMRLHQTFQQIRAAQPL